MGGVMQQTRQYTRETFKIPVRIQIQKKDISGYTHDISPSGLLIYSEAILTSGVPIALQFSFGENLCYLNISGQVVFCRAAGNGGSHLYAIGIKFSAIRDFEQKILTSAVKELKQNFAIIEKSILKIVISEDTLAREAADYTEIISSNNNRRPSITLTDLLPRQKGKDYTFDAAKLRREWLSFKNGVQLEHIGKFNEDPQNMKGNIENLIGVAQIPIGVVGPLRVNGQFAKGNFYIPMATTEGALIYTVHQGTQLISLAGGTSTKLLKDEIHISPIFTFDSINAAQKFAQWLENNFERIKEEAEKATKHGKLLKIEPHILDKNVAVKFCYSTGDAMGMNMISFATEKACRFILLTAKARKFYIQSNFSAIKKVTSHNFMMGFGKTVIAEAVIPGSLIKRTFNITSEEIVAYYQLVRLATAHAGMIGINGHTANALAAVFIACGQDVASVVDSYVGVTNFELADNGSLYVSIKLPSLLIGTVGGGTDLATQRECLNLLGCYGDGNSKKFSEIVAATVLAGEITICARVANGTFVEGHKKYGRKTSLNSPLMKVPS